MTHQSAPRMVIEAMLYAAVVARLFISREVSMFRDRHALPEHIEGHEVLTHLKPNKMIGIRRSLLKLLWCWILILCAAPACKRLEGVAYQIYFNTSTCHVGGASCKNNSERG